MGQNNTEMSLFHCNWSYLRKHKSIVSIIAVSPAPQRFFPTRAPLLLFIFPLITVFTSHPFSFFFSPSQRKGCALVKYMFRYFVAGVYGIDLNLMPHFGSGFFLSTAWNLENTFTTNAQQLLSLTHLFCINFFQTKAIIFRLSKGNWISLHRLAKERTI